MPTNNSPPPPHPITTTKLLGLNVPTRRQPAKDFTEKELSIPHLALLADSAQILAHSPQEELRAPGHVIESSLLAYSSQKLTH